MFAAGSFRHCFDRNQGSWTKDRGTTIRDGDIGAHPGQHAQVRGRFHRDTNVECLSDRIGDLCHFPDPDGERQTRRCAQFRCHVYDLRQANLGRHHRFGDVHGNVDLIDVLKLDDAITNGDVLSLIHKTLGNHTVIGCQERRILELDL